MKIYVLVLVTYDHHRFQENLYAHTDKEKVIEFIDNYKDELPLWKYTEEPNILLNCKLTHWWIETFI